MKNSKKLIALVLAMVMIFALTASALAATTSDNTKMTVKVTIQGVFEAPTASDPDATETIEVCTNQAVTVPTGSTAYAVVEALSKSDSISAHDAVWKDVVILDADGNKTDKTGKALVSLSCNTQDVTNGVYGYYTWSGYSTTTKTLSNSSFTYYDCVYKGVNWTYSVTSGGTTVNPDVYMDSYTLVNNDTLTLTFLESSETWIALNP